MIPTAQAARLTMDREAIRRVAAEELDLPTARYQFADTFEELRAAARALGWPVVIKPIMSSSGKGQSVAKTEADLEQSWHYAQTGGRTGAGRVIVEEFIKFDSEITMLTVRSVERHVVLRSGRPPPGRRRLRRELAAARDDARRSSSARRRSRSGSPIGSAATASSASSCSCCPTTR